MTFKWIGKTDAKDGHGQFEEDGKLIHFDNFEDFFYLQRLFDLRKDHYFNAGRQYVLNNVHNYVKQEVTI